jgi:hypothetical protein
VTTPATDSQHRTSRAVLIALAVLVMLVGYTVIFHHVYAVRAPGANDFFSRWAGARLFLTRGWDPYGESASLWIQNVIYGHPAGAGEDPSLFAYPFYTVFVVAPYALISSYAWAQAAWQVTLQAVLVATLIALLAYHRWKPRPLMLGALLLWMIFFYPSARSVLLGQLGLVVFLLTVVALWLMLRREQPCPRCDVLAGVSLAITTIKPQMQFLIIPFVLLWAIRERRWQAIVAFGVTMLVLLGASFALLPRWLGEWIAQVVRYPGYTPPAVLYILTREVLPLGSAAQAAEWVLDAVLIAWLLAEWWRTLRTDDSRRLDWTLGATLVVTHLVAPRTATTHFVVFTFPLVMMLRDLAARRPWGPPVAAAAMLILTVSMWWLFLATVSGNQEANIVHVPLPLLMLALMLATRPRPTPSSQPAPA